MFRRNKIDIVEVLLAHPGGPFWKNKDDGAWTIPKGEFDSEPPMEAAIREFREEIGFAPQGSFIELTPIKQRGGKWVCAWGVEGDCDSSNIQSNQFSIEWPPRSGKMQSFPEVDRAAWFPVPTARKKILTSQWPLLDELISILERA